MSERTKAALWREVRFMIASAIVTAIYLISLWVAG